MNGQSLVPPEENTMPENEKKNVPGLLGHEKYQEYGQQLSSYTELKQSKKSRTLFVITDSPLKAD